MTDTERTEGWVVDLACLRRYPSREYLDRARVHSTECALMGHCIESGYALVRDDSSVFLLDIAATPLVTTTLREAGDRDGVRIVAHREFHDGEMVTQAVERPQ